MKYRAFYRCNICGEEAKGNDEVSKDIAENVTSEMSDILEAKAIIAGDSYTRRYIPHNCKNGSIGLLCFCGFKPSEG